MSRQTAKQPRILLSAWVRVTDRGGLSRKLDEVVRGGGEGLMLHPADAPYLTAASLSYSIGHYLFRNIDLAA